MTRLIYLSPYAVAHLTTTHAASSYGQPVLTVAGQAYGPADALPSGITAGEFVRMFLAGEDPAGGQWGRRTREAKALAERFLWTSR